MTEPTDAEREGHVWLGGTKLAAAHDGRLTPLANLNALMFKSIQTLSQLNKIAPTPEESRAFDNILELIKYIKENHA